MRSAAAVSDVLVVSVHGLTRRVVRRRLGVNDGGDREGLLIHIRLLIGIVRVMVITTVLVIDIKIQQYNERSREQYINKQTGTHT